VFTSLRAGCAALGRVAWLLPDPPPSVRSPARRVARMPGRRATTPRGYGSPFSGPPPSALVEVGLAELAVTRRRAVPAFRAVTRVPVLGPRVAKAVAVDVAEIPSLAGENALVAAGAIVEARLDRAS